VYELSVIESKPGISEEIEKKFKFKPDFERAKMFLEENDGAGNTFKATAKPVLIGTAVVGAATMIFALIMLVTQGLKPEYVGNLSMIHPPFLLGLVVGGAIIYWFTGASTQAVSTGAYRAVEFIKANIKLDGESEKASVEDSNRVVEICTIYAQKGMRNIFMVVFFSTLGFACLDAFFFIGYLISMALFGLYQAIFMANAGGAWDNAKKVVETELRAKGTDLHAATVVGDTVGDPFKDTSSVALNPVIKFTTLFGVLAVGLAIQLETKAAGPQGDGFYLKLKYFIAAASLLISMFYAWKSFYQMRIGAAMVAKPAPKKPDAVVKKSVSAAKSDDDKYKKPADKPVARPVETHEDEDHDEDEDEDEDDDEDDADEKPAEKPVEKKADPVKTEVGVAKAADDNKKADDKKANVKDETTKADD
jgi:K(+)-stimulated pyrophosphate-energized sodium pump